MVSAGGGSGCEGGFYIIRANQAATSDARPPCSEQSTRHIVTGATLSHVTCSNSSYSDLKSEERSMWMFDIGTIWLQNSILTTTGYYKPEHDIWYKLVPLNSQSAFRLGDKSKFIQIITRFFITLFKGEFRRHVVSSKGARTKSCNWICC